MAYGIYTSEPIITKDVQYYGNLFFNVKNKSDNCYINTYSRSMKNNAWTDWYPNVNGAIGARAGSQIQFLINITYDKEDTLEVSDLSFTYYNKYYQRIRLKAGSNIVRSFVIPIDGKTLKIRARSIKDKKKSTWITNQIIETNKDVYDKNTQLGFQFSKKPDTGTRDIRKGLREE